jgi:hypothetical protein
MTMGRSVRIVLGLLALCLPIAACTDDTPQDAGAVVGGSAGEADSGATSSKGGASEAGATEPGVAGNGGEVLGGATSVGGAPAIGGAGASAGDAGQGGAPATATCVERGARCTDKTHCKVGELCDAGQCKVGPTDCASDDDCGYANVCIGLKCQYDHLARGEKCGSSTDDKRTCEPGVRCDVFTLFVDDLFTCDRSDEGKRCCLRGEDSCTSDCEFGYYCDFMGVAPGAQTCHLHGELGDTCGYYDPGECALGLACRWDGMGYKCLAPGKLDEFCFPYYQTLPSGGLDDDTMPQQCEPDLYCDDSDAAEVGETPQLDVISRCTGGGHRQLVPLNTSCGTNSKSPLPRCPDGSACASKSRFAGPNCVPYTQLGEACFPNVYASSCLPGLVCAQRDPNVDAYSCLQPAALGDPCDANSLCANAGVCVGN